MIEIQQYDPEALFALGLLRELSVPVPHSAYKAVLAALYQLCAQSKITDVTRLN